MPRSGVVTVPSSVGGPASADPPLHHWAQEVARTKKTARATVEVEQLSEAAVYCVSVRVCGHCCECDRPRPPPPPQPII